MRKLDDIKISVFNSIRSANSEIELDSTLKNLKWMALNIASDARGTTDIQEKNNFIGQLESIVELATFIAIVNDGISGVDLFERLEGGQSC